MAEVTKDLRPWKGGATGDQARDRADDPVADPVLDLGFARLDVNRIERTGIPEVVYAEGKTSEQVVDCLAGLLENAPMALATRVDPQTADAIGLRWPEAVLDPVARCALIGTAPVEVGRVAVVSAGTSDASVAAETAFVARALGAAVTRINDVGVAGLHRLLAVRADIEAADVVIVVAGMDGALASAVGGLVSKPVVAVPTSVGYGAAFEGLAALLTMLNSCAPGVTVVNIDNGFGAAAFAAKVLARPGPPRAMGGDAFYASLPKRYVGSAVLITDEAGAILMVEPTYRSTWNVPGGVTEATESTWAAARRECREEIGIDVAVSRLLLVEHQTIAGRGDSIMFIYDGGTLPHDVALTLPADELRSHRFVAPADLDAVTASSLAHRLRMALRARSEGSLIELHDGHAVGCAGDVSGRREDQRDADGPSRERGFS